MNSYSLNVSLELFTHRKNFVKKSFLAKNKIFDVLQGLKHDGENWTKGRKKNISWHIKQNDLNIRSSKIVLTVLLLNLFYYYYCQNLMWLLSSICLKKIPDLYLDAMYRIYA